MRLTESVWLSGLSSSNSLLSHSSEFEFAFLTAPELGRCFQKNSDEDSKILSLPSTCTTVTIVQEATAVCK